MNASEELQKELEKKFLCPDKFAKEIEILVSKRDDLNYITAITEYCEVNSIDIESITKLISKTLKDRIQGDAIKLNFLKRTSRARLPL
jgi:Holliday junction resolvasome RuvABC ATP-dependent DNA helicase subunit